MNTNTEMRFDAPTAWNIHAALDAVTREVNPHRPAPRLDARPVAPVLAPVAKPPVAKPATAAKLAAALPVNPSPAMARALLAEVSRLSGIVAQQAAAQAVRDRAQADAIADLARQRVTQTGKAGAARDLMIARRR